LLRDERRCVSQTEAYTQRLGGFTARERPAFGLRPTLRFTAAATLTVAWVAFAVWFSHPWRDELEDAIGPITAWVIPTLLAYIPGLVIGFLCFTLLLTRYRPPPLEAPAGPWPEGQWPPITVIVAAYNEERAIEGTLETSRRPPTPVRSTWSSPITTRPIRPPSSPRRWRPATG
jgi:hypothetical protein